jgi:hypothetical protein
MLWCLRALSTICMPPLCAVVYVLVMRVCSSPMSDTLGVIVSSYVNGNCREPNALNLAHKPFSPCFQLVRESV